MGVMELAIEWVPLGTTCSDSSQGIWEGKTERTHHHKEAEITIVLDGTGTFQCGSHFRRVKEGSVCWIAPSFTHSFFRTSSLMRFATIHAGDLPSHLQGLYPVSVVETGAFIAQLTKSALREVESMVQICTALESSIHEIELAEQLRQSSLNILMTLLARYTPGKGQPLLTISEVVSLMRNNLQEEWDVSGMARLTGTSESHFRRLFKEIYGFSPKQYQQNCRRELALTLLSSTNRSIDHIASAIGFETTSSFSTWFRKVESVSPTEWRECKGRET